MATDVKKGPALRWTLYDTTTGLPAEVNDVVQLVFPLRTPTT
jgi:hypothetical protein